MSIQSVSTRNFGFTGAQGEVHPHTLTSTVYDHMDSPVQTVIFSRFDKQLEMNVEIGVHWTKFSEYVKKSWPNGGNVVAIVTKKGRRMGAKGVTMYYHEDSDYLAAPILCRDVFRVSLGSMPVVEVDGVAEYARNMRKEGAAEKFYALHASK